MAMRDAGRDRELYAAAAKAGAGPAPVRPPTLERVGVGYRLVFAEVRVEILVPRVHWHREDAVAIYAISILPAIAGQATQRIDHGSLNLYASTTRARLAKQLLPRWEADWEEILRQASAAVLERETMGEEPVELDDVADDVAAPNLVSNLCLRDDPTMIFGNGGDGKSYVALGAAISIATGQPILGIQPSERLRVAYLDWEWSGAEHKRRKRRLVGDERIEGGWLYYFRCRHPLPQEVDRLAVQFNRLGIGYAIIDSVAWACGGAPEESGMATAYQAALRALGVGTLSVAHVNRSGDTNQPFGSVYWHNSMRATWYCKKQQEVGEEEVHLGLFNRKANGGRLERPLGFALSFADGRTVIRRVDPGTVAELAGQMSLRDRMIALLRKAGRPMTYAEIGAHLQADVQQVRNKAAQSVFQVIEATEKGEPKRLALAAQTGLAENENRFGGQSKLLPKPVGGFPVRETPGGLVVCPGVGEGENGPTGGLPGGLPRAGEEGSPRCPTCGFQEYQPLGGGRRKCLSCEGVWE